MDHCDRIREAQMGRTPGAHADWHVSRRAVQPEPLLDGGHDYADCFEIQLHQPDVHTAEEWIRTALERSPSLRQLIRIVHVHVARFHLSSPGSDADHILGWRIASATPDVVLLETAGPLLRAAIVARRHSPTSATLTTFLYYERLLTRPMWWAIGPLHRRIVPYLLEHAAAEFARADRRDPAGAVH
jgi:hypothetical protein